MKYFLIYLAVINVATFCFYAADKIFAIKGMWRIPERRLLLLAVAGGAAGATAGIFLLRHKTKHRQFAVGVPVMLAVELLLLAAAAYAGML